MDATVIFLFKMNDLKYALFGIVKNIIYGIRPGGVH
jgi:hypothetical protein